MTAQRYDVAATHCLNAGRNRVLCDAVQTKDGGRFVLATDYEDLERRYRALESRINELRSSGASVRGRI